MTENYNLGTLAFSKAGHDRGELFLIVKAEAEHVYLVDGKLRKLENPKKKNKKHIQPVFKTKEAFTLPMTNESVKRYIKNYKQEHDL